MTKAEREERRVILERLKRDARLLVSYFRLELHSIEPERAQVKQRYGVCYSDGSIRIRLHHARTGRMLKYSGMVDTLCHELAHLRHFNHGPKFRAFYLALLDFARGEGIYQPGRPETRATPAAPTARAPKRRNPPVQAQAGPRQLELF